ncbi:polyphosphate kinase 2 [bacterium BMS3Abin04]|nr:polyphosphate kinase 2 [bacterium BMS3Abin04]
MDLSKFKISNGKNFSLSNYKTNYTGDVDSKKKALKLLEKHKKKMAELQDKLYAHNKYGILIILQAMDAAGKDSAIKHVMSGVNPQGTQVFSFKQPSKEELDHDYLWRTTKALPERGRIGIFNRSYYEEVLVVKLHNLIKYQRIPEEFVTKDIWKKRYRQIRDFEKYIYENGIVTLKFFLHVSKDEQKKRFIERLENPAKNWKFSTADLKERGYWDEYQKCYEEAIAETSTSHSPWYVVPADKKWFTRLVLSEVINKTLESLPLKYPQLKEEELKNIKLYKKQLLSE